MEPLCLLAGWAVFAAADTFQLYMLVGFAALACPWILRSAARLPASRQTPLDGAMALFAGTALLGVLTAYDPAIAARQFGLVLVSVSAFYTLVNWCDSARRLQWAAAGIIATALALGVYFVTQRDWSTAPEKFAPVVWLGRGLNGVVPNLGVYTPHPNIVAVVQLLGLGLAAAAAWKAARGWRVAWSLATIALAGMLVMTVSRSTWLALAAAGAIWAAGRLAGRRALAVAAPGVFGAVLGATVLFPTSLERALGVWLGAGDGGILRTGIWAASGGLARDYLFTGGGLGMFPMLYGAYAQLAPGAVVPHAHNLYLSVAVEQGVAGALALIWVLAATAWQALRHGSPAHPLSRAGLWITYAWALVWVLDTMPYADRAAGFVFAPLALAWAGWALGPERQPAAGTGSQPSVHGAGWRCPLPAAYRLPALLTALFALLVVVLAGDPLAAAYANAGALLQARAELQAYRVWAEQRAWIDCRALARDRGWPFVVYLSCARVPDAPEVFRVRRMLDEDEVEYWLLRAVARAPGNVTARERLGALALARGDAPTALADLRAAYAAGSRTAATRLLLADALAGTGALTEAVEQARGVEGAGEYFEVVAWRREWRMGHFKRAADDLAIAATLVPESTEWRARAQLLRTLLNFYYISDKY